MVLKGSTSPFEFLKIVLTWNIETVRDFERTDQVASLVLIAEDLEKDVGEWHHLNSTDPTPFVEEKVKRLSDHMKQTYVKAQQALEAEPQEMKFLGTKKIKITNAIDASNNALTDANEQLEKAEAMI